MEIHVYKSKLWRNKITNYPHPVWLHTLYFPFNMFAWDGMFAWDFVWNHTFNNIAEKTSSLKATLELASEEQIWLAMICYPRKQTDNQHWNFAPQKCLVVRVVTSSWQLAKITNYLTILACHSTGLFMLLQKRWQCYQSPPPTILQPTSKCFDNPELCRKQNLDGLYSVRVRLYLGSFWKHSNTYPHIEFDILVRHCLHIKSYCWYSCDGLPKLKFV